ncbi:MAG TPA: transposase [Hyphomonas atlantica]|uniref:Transposase n=3 Tax=Hyphomonadaceae TaxID=69657 RepID=A0A356W7L2_9PROT|nr:transposase [Hyphomonas atlantica]
MRYLPMISALAVLAGCSSSGKGNLESYALPLPDNTFPVRSADFRAGPLDKIEIKVLDLPDLDGTYTLNIEGRTKLPLLGDMNLLGLTALEVAELIEVRLAESYLRSPDVVASLTPAYIEQVTVEGAVESPGTYDVRPGLTLLEAVALSGGAADDANQRRAVIVRRVDGQRLMATFDLVAIREGEAADPPIYGNDLIIMDGSMVRSAFLDIVRTGPLLAAFRPIW